jgi:hypothetical protein
MQSGADGTLRPVYDVFEDRLGLFKDDPFPRGAQLPARPRTLAASYISEALEAVQNAGDTAALYDPLIRSAATRATQESWFRTAAVPALERRTRFSRNAMLFAAFAAEAYINEFVAQHSTGQDFETLDRLSTVEKYVMSPRLLLGREVFVRDAEPIQSLRKLFRRRDVLVHPKPEKGVPDRANPAANVEGFAADAVYNPLEAAHSLIAVATAAVTIVREGRLGHGVDEHAQAIIDDGQVVVAAASRATKRLPRPQEPALATRPLPGPFAQPSN